MWKPLALYIPTTVVHVSLFLKFHISIPVRIFNSQLGKVILHKGIILQLLQKVLILLGTKTSCVPCFIINSLQKREQENVRVTSTLLEKPNVTHDTHRNEPKSVSQH